MGYYGNKSAETVWVRLVSASTSFLIYLLIYGGLTAIVYFFAGTLYFIFPYKVAQAVALRLSDEQITWTVSQSDYSRTYQATTAFLLCLLTPLCLQAALLFGIFGGAGMALLPAELILSYLSQPTKPSAEEYVLSKKILLLSSERILGKIKEAYDVRKDLDLNPIPNPVEKKMKMKILNDKVTEMKTELAEFEEVFLVFKAQDNIVDSNPLVYVGQLVAGVIFLLIAIAFLVHTFLSLKGFFVVLDTTFNGMASIGSILAIIVFLIVSLFVGMAIIKASIKLSGLTSILTGILPFKLNATWTDAFLLNDMILLLSLLGMVLYFSQFCPLFLRFTASSLVFAQVIMNISFVHFIFNYMIPQYLFMVFFLIGIVMLIFNKSAKAILDEKIKEEQVKLEAEKERVKEMEGGKDAKKDDKK
jgi:hypothetical protein